jgi:hypothetical protein
MSTLNGFLTSDGGAPLGETATEPVAYEFQSDLSDDEPDPLTLDAIASASLALTGTLQQHPQPSAMDWVAAEASSHSQSATNGQANDVAREQEDGHAARIRPVDIEVRLPWLSPARRAAYEYIKVPLLTHDEYQRLRRRQLGVRPTYIHL